jgi:hypothetical protein
VEYIIKVLPGRTLEAIALVAREILPNYESTNYYCIIHAGICSLTVKTTSPFHRHCLTYPLQEREDKLKSIKDTLTDLKSRFGARINFCTVVPASLHKYFYTKNPDQQDAPPSLNKEQEALLEDIVLINETIKQLNINYHNTNINLCARFVTHSKKKHQRSNTGNPRRVTKFKDTELIDGVHFSEELRQTSFHLIKSAIDRDLEYLHQLSLGPLNLSAEELDELLNSSQDSQPDADRNWDFKRKGSS